MPESARLTWFECIGRNLRATYHTAEIQQILERFVVDDYFGATLPTGEYVVTVSRSRVHSDNWVRSNDQTFTSTI